MTYYSLLKSKIPVSLKKVPWYIFKSPQRELGYFTLWIDLKGFCIHLINALYFALFSPQLKPVSICTGLKNRSSNYLDILLESVMKMDHPDLIELSVFDCSSDDIPDLEKAIKNKWKGQLMFTFQKIEFTRSDSFNRAIKQCCNELIFVSDADMSLPKNLVKQCNRIVRNRNVWFPVCFQLDKVKPEIYNPENGKWYPVGKGMFAARKSDVIKIGLYDESFREWGGEDWELWYRFYKNSFFPFRNKQRGLFHHYHVSLKPDNYSDKKQNN